PILYTAISGNLKLSLIKMVYKNIFFDSLVKGHPIFSMIDFDCEEIIVQEDFFESMSIVENSSNPIVSLYDTIKTKKILSQDNERFSAYGDIATMTEENFWLMGELLTTLCLNAQSYCVYLNSEEIKQFINTAVRLYNKFYGKGHSKYIGSIHREAWTTHRIFAEYLFYLDWAFGIAICGESKLNHEYKLIKAFADDDKTATGKIMKMISPKIE
ncbi:MAG: hypothetical protein K2J47_03450, partial [Ruminococcus sp.]|nr:hypothetical protein [Ruminococcus sp.]